MLSFCDYYMTNLKETSVDNKWRKLEQAIKNSMKANIPCKGILVVSIFSGLAGFIEDYVKETEIVQQG